MTPLPPAAPAAESLLTRMLSSVTNFLFPKPNPDVPDRKIDRLKVPMLFGLGTPKSEIGEDTPKATVMFPRGSGRGETDSIWKSTGFANTNEHNGVMSDQWNDYRKHSLHDQEPLMLREISLLIFTWVAAIFICGTIMWVMVKIERKIHLLMERDVLGFEEKKVHGGAQRRAFHGLAITVIIAKFLLLIAVILSLKGSLGKGSGGG
ncbi:hypothetical protein HOY80DRAFT_1044210 [Tuber brumale]|nr:hypothetical protein HOY80DRAFT_1044210 [Tuber brumale]